MRRAACRVAPLVLLACCALWPLRAAAAAVIAEDDEGHLITLAQPARRIVSLAPQVTELLFEAGAGARVVGTVALANHPPEATKRRHVGDTGQLDLKAVAALKPQLIIAWPQGHTAAQWTALQKMKVPIYSYRDPKDWARLAVTLRQFGALAGTGKTAQAAAASFEGRLRALRTRWPSAQPLPVFVQLWPEPLLTVGREHPAMGTLALCGAVNAVAGLAGLEPGVAPIERAAVLAAKPQALVVAEAPGAPPEALTEALAIWRDERGFDLVSRQAVVPAPTEVLATPTPRALAAAERLCEGLDRLRARQR